MTGSSTKRLCTEDNNYGRCYRKLLPPPDQRRIIITGNQNNQESQESTNKRSVQVEVPSTQYHASLSPDQTISSGNTTIIGDYVATAFDRYDKKWLVQAKGNATVQSVLLDIKDGNITGDRRYIFITLGHNQLHNMSKAFIADCFQSVWKMICERNVHAKIFVAALLPHPVDYRLVKPQIVKLNRALATVINRIRKQDPRVLLLPVQHSFIKDSQLIMELYSQDRYTLSSEGAKHLKKQLFEMAGFGRNDN